MRAIRSVFMTKKIVITGGPSTGKTTLINALKQLGYNCFDEISRQVTLEARQQGIEQLFLEDPLLFSQKLLEGRTEQFKSAEKATSNLVFLDRGIPDVLAYMDYIGDTYPKEFTDRCTAHRYDAVVVLQPWEDIYATDEERYESFEQAKLIHHHLESTYTRFKYNLIELPKDTVPNRVNFLLDFLNL